MRAAYRDPDPLHAEATLEALARSLDKSHPGAAGSLREGLAETFTVNRLGVGPTLARMLRSTNAIESMIEICRDHSSNVKRYLGPVSGPRVPGGAVHRLPADLRKALIANQTALDAWKDITPLARNEFICWVEDAKQEMTRERRIRRTQEELEEGQRRPCCWPGCKHRERTSR